MSIFDVRARENQYNGTLYNMSPEARVAYNRQQDLSVSYGTQLTMQDTMFAVGADNCNDTIKQIGFEIGANKDANDNNVNFDSYVSSATNKDDMLFQGNDGILYNLNFTTGDVTSQSVEEFAVDHGMANEGDKFYDIVEFGKDSAEFIDYEFEGLGDGQDNVKINVADSKWSTVDYVYQEVDPTLFGSGSTSTEANIANKAYNTIMTNTRQWMRADDYDTLAASSSSADYLRNLINLAVKNLTQISNAKSYDEMQAEAQAEAEAQAQAEAEAQAQAEAEAQAQAEAEAQAAAQAQAQAQAQTQTGETTYTQEQIAAAIQQAADELANN